MKIQTFANVWDAICDTPEEAAKMKELCAMRRIEEELESDSDDGAAAKAHLAAGRPIYYFDDALQGNVRKWPDGRCELVEIDDQGVIVVLRSLP